MVRGAASAAGAALVAALIGLRLLDGSALFLVQSWYAPVLLLSVVVLAGLAAIATLGLLRDRASTQKVEFRPGVLVGGGMVAVVLVLGFAFKPEPLGSASLGDDGASESASFSTSAKVESGDRNLYQWAYEFATSPASQLTGEPVDLVGFVYHRDGGADGRFEVARFVVACCVADAQGFTLPVEWADSKSLTSDSWVRIAGTVETDSTGAAVIRARTVETIEPPSNPYIYP